MSQAVAWLLTLLIEIPIVLFFSKRWGITWQRAALAGVLASSITHPLAWNTYWAATVVWQTEYPRWWLGWIELWVWLMEAGIFHLILSLARWRSLGLSLIANAVSALIGVAITWL